MYNLNWLIPELSICSDNGADDGLVDQVIAGFWVLSIIGGWCNFVTLFYIGNSIVLLAISSISMIR